MFSLYSVMTSGYQSSLLVWASPRMTAAQRAPDPDRRRAEAERLGLQWPEPRVKRGRGPPIFKEKFREAVYQAIRGQKWDVLEQLENAEMHPGWRPGSPLVGSPAGMVAGMAVAEQLAPKEHEEAAPEEEHEEACLDEGDITDMEACLDEGDMETPSKKSKVHVDRHYQVWFLQWAAHMKATEGWSTRKSFETVRGWMPEVYGGPNVQVYKGWKKPAADPNPRGPKTRLSDVQLTKLATLARSLVAKGVPVNAEIVQGIVLEEIHPLRVSKTWVRGFLVGLGFSWRRTQGGDRIKFTEEEVACKQHRLALKVNWVMREHSVPVSRVWNLDETFVQYLTFPKASWRDPEGATPETYVPEMKAGVTATAVTPASWGEPWFLQLLFKGKTSRVHPDMSKCSENVTASHSESGWANADTICELLAKKK